MSVLRRISGNPRDSKISGPLVPPLPAEKSELKPSTLSDSGLLLLPDSLTRSERARLGALIDAQFIETLMEVSENVARVVLGSESTISFNMPYISTPGSSEKEEDTAVMIPSLPYLEGVMTGETIVGPVELEHFLEYVVLDVFEVDGREISPHSLREAIRWTIEIIFSDIDIDDDQDALTDEQLKKIGVRVNSPALQLANATLLRTILKIVESVEKDKEINETGLRIKAAIGKDEKRIEISKKRRGHALVQALDKKSREEVKNGTNENKIFSFLMNQDHLKIYLDAHQNMMVDFDELMKLYIKLSHRLSRLALKEIPREYIEDIALAGLESLTEGVKLAPGEEYGDNQKLNILANLVNPADPTWSAVIRYLLHKKGREAVKD